MDESHECGGTHVEDTPFQWSWFERLPGRLTPALDGLQSTSTPVHASTPKTGCTSITLQPSKKSRQLSARCIYLAGRLEKREYQRQLERPPEK
jgi:hypothetical protein